MFVKAFNANELRGDAIEFPKDADHADFSHEGKWTDIRALDMHLDLSQYAMVSSLGLAITVQKEFYNGYYHTGPRFQISLGVNNLQYIQPGMEILGELDGEESIYEIRFPESTSKVQDYIVSLSECQSSPNVYFVIQHGNIDDKKIVAISNEPIYGRQQAVLRAPFGGSDHRYFIRVLYMDGVDTSAAREFALSVQEDDGIEVVLKHEGALSMSKETGG